MTNAKFSKRLGREKEAIQVVAVSRRNQSASIELAVHVSEP